MKEWLTAITEYAVLIIDALAFVIIVIGTVRAFVTGIAVTISPSAAPDQARMVWLRYARALVAALTFQLAADIIESSITTSWESVGRLAAIAVIRTFLNYFLERDLAELRERVHEQQV